MTIRKAFRMSVNAGQEAEYERRHTPIWRELEDTLLDKMGVRQETIGDSTGRIEHLTDL